MGWDRARPRTGPVLRTEEPPVSARKWLAAAVVAGFALPGFAAEPTKTAFGFSTLKPTADAVAKAKLEGWLKATGKFDAARFEAVWAQPGRTVQDRTLDSIALGIPEAATLVAGAKQADAAAPTEIPAVLKDTKL